MASFDNKIDLFKKHIANLDLEAAFSLLNSIYSGNNKNVNELRDMQELVIRKIFNTLIDNKNFNEALNRLKIYRRKYFQCNKIFEEIEFLIYFKMASKEFNEENFNVAKAYLEKAMFIRPNNDSCNALLIPILIHDEKYDQALNKIKELEKTASNDYLYSLKILKALALNNKAMKIEGNNLEESLNLLYQSNEIKQSDRTKNNIF